MMDEQINLMVTNLIGDMPWVTEHLSDKQIRDLKKQIATCFNHHIVEQVPVVDSIDKVIKRWTSMAEIRLRCGEMTAQEARTVKAVTSGFAHDLNRALKALEPHVG